MSAKTINGRRINSIRRLVRIRSGGCCEFCGVRFLIVKNRSTGTLHHRLKQEYDGIDSLSNLVNLCTGCHKTVHMDEESAARLGLIAEYPEMTPVFLLNKWVLIDEKTRNIDYDDAETLISLSMELHYEREQWRRDRRALA